MFEYEIKFEPVTVTVVPKEPLVGFRVIVEVVTLKLVEAVLKLLSVIVTRLLPAVEPAGTVKTAPALILPFASVVPLNGIGEPLKVATSLELAAKPLPVTVTGSPAGPLLGESVMGEPAFNFTASAIIPQGNDPPESVQFTDKFFTVLFVFIVSTQIVLGAALSLSWLALVLVTPIAWLNPGPAVTEGFNQSIPTVPITKSFEFVVVIWTAGCDCDEIPMVCAGMAGVAPGSKGDVVLAMLLMANAIAV